MNNSAMQSTAIAPAPQTPAHLEVVEVVARQALDPVIHQAPQRALASAREATLHRTSTRILPGGEEGGGVREGEWGLGKRVRGAWKRGWKLVLETLEVP